MLTDKYLSLGCCPFIKKEPLTTKMSGRIDLSSICSGSGGIFGVFNRPLNVVVGSGESDTDEDASDLESMTTSESNEGSESEESSIDGDVDEAKFLNRMNIGTAAGPVVTKPLPPMIQLEPEPLVALTKDNGETDEAFALRQDLYNRISNSKFTQYAAQYSKAITDKIMKRTTYSPEVENAINTIVQDIGYKMS